MQLGAQPLLPRGDGDDQHYLGLDGGLDPWLKDLWTILLKKHPVPPGMISIPDASLREFFKFAMLPTPNISSNSTCVL